MEESSKKRNNHFRGIKCPFLRLKLDSDKKQLLENFFSLFILQGTNFILPLITLPYLVRVLGPEKFGIIAFAQAFIQYFNILTDYGFNLSATREISLYRENKEKVSEIFSSVMFIKVGLLILSFLIMSIIVFSFEKFRKDWLIYYLTFGTVVGQALFPVWFFQGLERMRYITAIEVGIKMFFLLLIFLFVDSPEDFWKVPLINTIGVIVGGIISIFIILKQFCVKFRVLNVNFYFKYLKISQFLFLSQASVSLFNQTNTFIGGLIFNYTLIGYYNAAEKLFVALRNIFGIVFRVFHPYFSRNRKGNFFSLYSKIVIVISTMIAIFLFVSADFLVNLLYGPKFQLTKEILKIFSVTLLFSGINIMLFTLWFLSNGFYKFFFWITTFAGFSNIVLLCFFAKTIGILGIPLCATIVEIILLILYYVYRVKILANSKL